MVKDKLIQSIEELKEICLSQQGGYVDFFIVLAGGSARSSKQVSHNANSDTFSVIDEIDFSYQDDLTAEELRNETLIVQAIEQKAFYKYL